MISEWHLQALRKKKHIATCWLDSWSRSILTLSWTEHLWQMPQMQNSPSWGHNGIHNGIHKAFKSQGFEDPPYPPPHPPVKNPLRSQWRQLLLWQSFSLRFPPRSSLFAVWRQLWQSWIDWTAVKIPYISYIIICLQYIIDHKIKRSNTKTRVSIVLIIGWKWNYNKKHLRWIYSQKTCVWIGIFLVTMAMGPAFGGEVALRGRQIKNLPPPRHPATNWSGDPGLCCCFHWIIARFPKKRKSITKKTYLWPGKPQTIINWC